MKAFLKTFTLCFFVFLAHQARAQTLSGGGTLFSEIAPKWHMGVTAETGGEFALPSDVSDSLGGDVGVYSFDINIKAQAAWEMRHFLTLSIDGAYDYFDFSDARASFSGLNSITASLFYTFRVSETWGAFAMSNFSFASQENESLWGGRQFVGGFGVTYSISDWLNLGFGGAAYSRMDRNWTGLPIAFIDWKINDKLRLRTFAGAALFYDIFGDESLVFSFSVEYKNTYYRLEDNAAGIKRSVRDNYIQLYVGATYNITKRAYVSASIGAALDRDLQTRTGGGKSERIEIDASPSVIIKLGYRL